MNSLTSRGVCAALVWLMPGCGAVLAQPGPAVRPPFDEIGIDQKLGARLEMTAPLRDEEGRAVTLAGIAGERPVVLVLAYYRCPMLCSLVVQALASTMEVMRSAGMQPGRDYQVVTVSIDPRDTAASATTARARALERYGHTADASGWRFLTADEATVRALAQQIGFRYVYDPRSDQYAHASGIMVVTPQGKVSHYFLGLEYSPKDLRLALVEASQGRIGTLVDQIKLLCYQYDPATGRYGPTAIGVMRIGGVITVAALAGFIIVMLRRERRGMLRSAAPEARLHAE